jgi:hypothetical protein
LVSVTGTYVPRRDHGGLRGTAPDLLPFAAVGSILDLTVVVLAVVVCVSLGLLAWTLGVSVTRVARSTRENLISARLELTLAERRLRDAARVLAEAGESRTGTT